MRSTSNYAQQSDPDFNHNFRRRWSEPLDQLSQPCRLDREADALMIAGNHIRAEFLARRAAAIREGGR